MDETLRRLKVKQHFDIPDQFLAYCEYDEKFRMIYQEHSTGFYLKWNYDKNDVIIFKYKYFGTVINFCNIIIK